MCARNHNDLHAEGKEEKQINKQSKYRETMTRHKASIESENLWSEFELGPKSIGPASFMHELSVEIAELRAFSGVGVK